MSICKNGIARLRVRAENGNDSKLYADLLGVFEGNRDEALKAYAYANSDHYKQIHLGSKLDTNGEYLVEDVILSTQTINNFDSPKIDKNTKTGINSQMYTIDGVDKRDIFRARDLIARKKTLLTEAYKQMANAKLEGNAEQEYLLFKRVNRLKKEIDEIGDELDATAMAPIAVKDLKNAEMLLNKPVIESHDLIHAMSIVNIWRNAVTEFFPESSKSKYIMNGEGASKSGLTDFEGFSKIQGEAQRLSERIEDYEKQFLNQQLSEEVGREIDIAEEFENQKDYTGVHVHTMSINRTNNVMFQAVSNQNSRLMSKAKDEFRDFEQEFDKVLEDAMPDLKAMSNAHNPYDILREKYKDGKETGDLITQFRPEYKDAAAVKFKEAIDESTVEAWEDYYKWFDENNVILDWRILFDGEVDADGQLLQGSKRFSETDKVKMREEIVGLVGQEEYLRMVRLAERSLEEFKATRELVKDDIYNNPKITTEEKDAAFDNWNKSYSPFRYANVVKSHKPDVSDVDIIASKGHAHTAVIPRQYVKGTKTETGWYNEEFNKIRNNESVYAFYNLMIDTLHELNSVLPHNVSKNLSDNSIPNMRKSVMDAFFSEGSKAAKEEIMNRVIKAMTAENSSDMAFAEVDPYTNEIKKNLTINLVKQNNERINKIYTQKLIDFENKNGAASTAQKRDIKKEAVDEVVKDKSFDLGQIIKVYFLTTKMYAKKAQIEDLVRISDSVFKNQKEVERTSDGRPKKSYGRGGINKKGKDESFTNIKKQWDYWTDYFYGYRSEIEGLSKRKMLTEKQKAEKEKIEELLVDLTNSLEAGKIDFEEYSVKSQKLETQIVELGGSISAGKIGRAALKFVQLKAMGWNAFSGLTNMSFGWVANIQEAQDGRVYNMNDLGWASKKVFQSVLKNWMFNQVETADAKKIRSLVERFDILSETSNEIYQRTYKSNKHKPLDWAKPFNIQNRTEYFNQAPIMMAIMHNTFFETTKGKVMAYECFDENGKWNEAEFGPRPDKEVGSMQNKIAEEIARIHGNYNSENPILANKKVWTTAMKQFRTWMFEGVADRFQTEIYSEALQIDLKGRYRTGFAFFNWSKSKDQQGKDGVDFATVVENTGYTTIQLLRKLTFQGTKFDEKFTEVDAANLRKNLSEFVMLMNISGMLMLMSMLGGDDDDNIAKFYMKNYITNLLFRVQDDLLYYVSPDSFEQLTKQSIPAMSLVTDASYLMKASIDTAMGNGRITRGIYTGEHKLVRAINKNLPFFSKVQSNISAMKQVYGEVSHAKK